jgi:hypothetical protein
MAEILWFKDINDSHMGQVGQKSADLAKLFNEGLGVPAGFVLGSEFYERFLDKGQIKKKIHELEESATTEDDEALQKTANEIQKMIVYSDFPEDLKEALIENYGMLNTRTDVKAEDLLRFENPLVAVRSSSLIPDPFSQEIRGNNKSYIHVKGEERLINSVKYVWASNFTLKSLKHKKQNNLKNIGMAVIIQAMVPQEISGISESVNVLNGKSGEILVKACYGYSNNDFIEETGYDTFNINKNTLEKKEINVGTKTHRYIYDEDAKKLVKLEIKGQKSNDQVISDREAINIARVSKKAETVLSSPQIIEWTLGHETVHIINAKPLTGFEPEEEQAETKEELPENGVEADEEPEGDEIDLDTPSDVAQPMFNHLNTISESEEKMMNDEAAERQRTEELDESLGGEESEDEPEQEKTEPEHSQEHLEKAPEQVTADTGYDDNPIGHEDESGDEPEQQIDTNSEEEEKEEMNEGSSEEEPSIFDSFNAQKQEDEVPETESPAYEESGGEEEENPDDETEEKKQDDESTQTDEDDSDSEEEPEEGASPKRKIRHPHEIMEKAVVDMSSVIVSCDLAIMNALKQQYSQIYGTDPIKVFSELLSEIKKHREIPYEHEIKRIHNHRNSFLENYEAIDMDDLKESIEVAKRFLDEL